jgi:hypothetical protein
MLVPLWLKWLKESVVSPERFVDVGTTVAEMVKGRCCKAGQFSCCSKDFLSINKRNAADSGHRSVFCEVITPGECSRGLLSTCHSAL